MTTTQRTHIKLRDAGELIAAVPHLLGFRPANSLVIAAHTGGNRSNVSLCLRADIPTPDLYWSLAEQLQVPVLRANACGVSVLVVCDGVVDPPLPLPHSALVEAVTKVFGAVGVAVYHAFWTPEIAKDASWWCYTNLECNGQLPDPTSSPLAAASAASGSITYDSRAEMRASLEPVDRYPLALRAERIKAALLHQPDEARATKLVADAIADVRDGTLTLDDDRIVDLAVALSHMRVRDGCLKPEVIQLGRPLEQLWADLTRALPVPYRAEAACLLAFTAFLQGDGAKAGVALDAALEANPEHWGAQLLRYSMDWGLPPTAVAEAVAHAFHGEQTHAQN
ncbi:hypothetical protein JOF56_011341 [Kibdelosporangium banguiense]|uniref:DUF4192 domain-containing protein n=1 Tax=Kibdelosporangium banguiense TaxID=1365924 RepID=A0ABS4U439_9PSEU|nr:DUF4192 domain-containing protein [Kibdelosporangium banguiense]MBP2330956.1 hypothetical protein [Kibdelosporangium banguiense]